MTTPTTPTGTQSAFKQLLDEVPGDDTLLAHLQHEDEAADVPSQDDWTTSPDTLTRPISDSATDLVITFEVSSREACERRYRPPIWPRGRSGITIGIGYDVAYVTQAVLARDWSEWRTRVEPDTLGQAYGVAGAAALVQPLTHR